MSTAIAECRRDEDAEVDGEGPEGDEEESQSGIGGRRKSIALRYSEYFSFV